MCLFYILLKQQPNFSYLCRLLDDPYLAKLQEEQDFEIAKYLQELEQVIIQDLLDDLFMLHKQILNF